MVFGKDDILKQIAAGRIVIDPFDEKAVGIASVELTLKPEFGIFSGTGGPVDVSRPTGSALNWIPASKSRDYKLESGGCLVGKTREKISLPLDICAWITPKARTAVFDLSLEISSGFIQPGTNNEHLFFLITNSGRLPILLHPGIRICQLVLNRL